jgi:hypothetical protein
MLAGATLNPDSTRQNHCATVLAGIVAIRTFLSFSLETEIEGCWPWQRAAKDAAESTRANRSN